MREGAPVHNIIQLPEGANGPIVYNIVNITSGTKKGQHSLWMEENEKKVVLCDMLTVIDLSFSRSFSTKC